MNVAKEEPRTPVIREFVSSLEEGTKQLAVALSKNPNASVSQLPADLQNIKDELDNNTLKYDTYARFKELNPDVPLEQATFSDVTWRQLKFIGVSRRTIPRSSFLDAIEDGLTTEILSVLFASFWHEKKDYIVTSLRDLIELYGRPSEALARVLVCRILVEVCLFLKRRLSCIPYILLELTVGSLRYRPAIIEKKVEEEQRALGLTGRLDYFLLTCLLGPTDLANSLGFTKQDMERDLRAIPNQLSLDRLLSIPCVSRLATESNYLTFTTVEAKPLGKELKGYEKQAVGQLLAVMKKIGRKRMHWCITNGYEWLFGILREHADGFQSVRISDTIAFDPSLNDTTNLQLIMKTMTFWAYASENLINNVFKT